MTIDILSGWDFIYNISYIIYEYLRAHISGSIVGLTYSYMIYQDFPGSHLLTRKSEELLRTSKIIYDIHELRDRGVSPNILDLL